MVWSKRFFAIAVITFLPCRYSAAQETNHPTAPMIISASHRFVVGGMTSAENVSLTASAEDVARRIEEYTQRAIPFTKGQPLQLIARGSTNESGGCVIRAQGWADRALTQKLIIVNPELADQEDILEGLCWLLLNRYVVARQSVEQKTEKLGMVPDWLSTGMAQNLYLALRARNSQIVIRRWRENEGLPFKDILGFVSLPEGRWREKAFCGMAVGWIASRPDAIAIFEALFSRFAGGDDSAAGVLSILLTGRDSVRELEKGWDLWIASHLQVKQFLGGVSGDRLEELNRLLSSPPDEMGIPAGEGIPASLTMRQLIEYRDDPWMPLYASRLNLHLRSLGIGEAKQFRDVLDLYGKYLDALSRPRRGLDRLPFFRASPAALNKMLAEADRGLAGLDPSLQRQNRYMTGIAASVAGGIVIPVTVSNTIADMERTILRSEPR